jgi:hypothetical protein
MTPRSPPCGIDERPGRDQVPAGAHAIEECDADGARRVAEERQPD